MPHQHDRTHITVFGGVDTHTDTHHAAALDHHGQVLGDAEFPATPEGCTQLFDWLSGFGPVTKVGVEGTGSYGKQLATLLRHNNIEVREVSRPNRRTRRNHGKSDVIDAINAARTALSGDNTSTPKTAAGPVESIRALRVVRGGAVKARTAARNELTNLITTAPATLREALRGKKGRALLTACAALTPDLARLTNPTHGTMLALQAMAERITNLNQQITQLDKHLDPLVATTAPAWSACSESAQTSPASSSSLPATTPNDSTARQPSPNSAASHHYPPHPDAPTGTASTKAANDKPTESCTSPSSSASATAHAPTPTCNDAPNKASPNATSSAASNATSSAKPTPRS
nr:transposase [Lentzea indica]